MLSNALHYFFQLLFSPSWPLFAPILFYIIPLFFEFLLHLSCLPLQKLLQVPLSASSIMNFFSFFLINYFNSIFVKIKIWKSNILDLIIIFIYFYVIYNFLYKSFLTFFPRQNFCSASCSNISSTHLFFISLALSS